MVDRPGTVQSNAWVEGPDREYDEMAAPWNRLECCLVCGIN